MRFRIILALAPSVFCRRRLVGISAANKRSLPFGGAKWNRLRQDSAVGEASLLLRCAKESGASDTRVPDDDHTKIEGKLGVGATASVDYRTEDVIAVHVVVHSAAYSQ